MKSMKFCFVVLVALFQMSAFAQTHGSVKYVENLELQENFGKYMSTSKAAQAAGYGSENPEQDKLFGQKVVAYVSSAQAGLPTPLDRANNVALNIIEAMKEVRGELSSAQWFAVKLSYRKMIKDLEKDIIDQKLSAELAEAACPSVKEMDAAVGTGE